LGRVGFTIGTRKERKKKQPKYGLCPDFKLISNN
jgi:hypothetical protein